MREYYIYHHFDTKGRLFYVGKGTKKGKSYKGFSRAYSTSGRNSDWWKVANEGYTVKVIDISNNEEEILKKEENYRLNCDICVNKQKYSNFQDYKIVKIKEDIAILYVFSKTYVLFSNGEIYNYLGELLGLSDHNNEYKILTISKGEETKKNFYVHRLIAEAFVDNPNNYNTVNHKDRNRQNNNKFNLEWCSQEYNVNYSVDLGSYKRENRIKKVYQFDKKGNFIKEWERARDVSNKFECTEELIQQACQQKNIKKTPTAKGYIWIYKDDFENKILDKFNSTMKKLTKEENN